jgi:hypothetical protein
MKMVSLWVENWWNLQRVRELNINYTHSFIHSHVQELALEICRPFCQAPCFLIIGIELAPPSVLNNNKLYLLHCTGGCCCWLLLLLLLLLLLAVSMIFAACRYYQFCWTEQNHMPTLHKLHGAFIQIMKIMSQIFLHTELKSPWSLSLMEEFHLSVFCMYILSEAP